MNCEDSERSFLSRSWVVWGYEIFSNYSFFERLLLFMEIVMFVS